MSAETLRRAAALMRERATASDRAVALAVADWLDGVRLHPSSMDEQDAALAVANAYLEVTP